MHEIFGRMGPRVAHAWRYARLSLAYARATGVLVPASVLRRDFAAWCDSLQPDRSPVGDRAPWITFGARRRLERTVAAGTRVFEYGAGGSTLFFLDRGCSVTTVDHDPAWLDRVRDHVRPGAAWTCHHVPPCPAQEEDREYLSWFPRYRGLSFRRYVHVLDAYPPGTFDVVMVDGRARGPCLAVASRLVAADGLLVLDNSERPRYAPAIAATEHDGWRSAHFHGPGPYVIREFWNTTIFARDRADGGRRQPSAAPGRS